MGKESFLISRGIKKAATSKEAAALVFLFRLFIQ